ncbi:hypothetical protein NUU61_005277 [Penicillium alfredii]|uniref:Uncharacterized protein n=1 Tax=Penicillium alfredii TaxID=1506179 RepID=A0A9W9F993_9EURO|nr:uncharacterized protein NUU61_005277 [Penicillium alfredii]KAJ5095921.1 hypothetical protein NUU61_005277 [Penicillium alfredii]
MARLSNSAIIVIVLVGCLAVTALGAALFQKYNPADNDSRYSPPYEQGQYMRTVRMRNYGHLKQESLEGRDIESRLTPMSGYYQSPVERQ